MLYVQLFPAHRLCLLDSTTRLGLLLALGRLRALLPSATQRHLLRTSSRHSMSVVLGFL
jgi:hypothetical protein